MSIEELVERMVLKESSDAWGALVLQCEIEGAELDARRPGSKTFNSTGIDSFRLDGLGQTIRVMVTRTPGEVIWTRAKVTGPETLPTKDQGRLQIVPPGELARHGRRFPSMKEAALFLIEKLADD